MYESLGEMLILAAAIAVTWIVAYGFAARRATGSVADSYELQMLHARHRINSLESELGYSHLRPMPGWSDFELDSVSVTDPALHVTT